MITLAQVFATVLLLLAVSGELPRLPAPPPLLRAWVLVRPCRAGFACMGLQAASCVCLGSHGAHARRSGSCARIGALCMSVTATAPGGAARECCARRAHLPSRARLLHERSCA